MDVVKYFEEKKRMFDSLGRIVGRCFGVACGICPFHRSNNGRDVNCGDFEYEYPEEAAAIVKKWNRR